MVTSLATARQFWRGAQSLCATLPPPCSRHSQRTDSCPRPAFILSAFCLHPALILPSSCPRRALRNEPQTSENGRKTTNPADDRSLKKNNRRAYAPACPSRLPLSGHRAQHGRERGDQAARRPASGRTSPERRGDAPDVGEKRLRLSPLLHHPIHQGVGASARTAARKAFSVNNLHHMSTYCTKRKKSKGGAIRDEGRVARSLESQGGAKLPASRFAPYVAAALRPVLARGGLPVRTGRYPRCFARNAPSDDPPRRPRIPYRNARSTAHQLVCRMGPEVVIGHLPVRLW